MFKMASYVTNKIKRRLSLISGVQNHVDILDEVLNLSGCKHTHTRGKLGTEFPHSPVIKSLLTYQVIHAMKYRKMMSEDDVQRMETLVAELASGAINKTKRLNPWWKRCLETLKRLNM